MEAYNLAGGPCWRDPTKHLQACRTGDMMQTICLKSVVVTFAVGALTCISSAAKAANFPIKTVAMYDSVSDTGTSITSRQNPDIIVGTFRSLSNSVFGGATINDEGMVVFLAKLAGSNYDSLLTTSLETDLIHPIQSSGNGALHIPIAPVTSNNGVVAWKNHKLSSPLAGEIVATLPDGTLTHIVKSTEPIGNTGYTFGSTVFLNDVADAQPPAVSNTHIVFKAIATSDDYYCSRPFVCYSGYGAPATIRYTIATGAYDILLRQPENTGQTQSGRFVHNLENVDVNDNGTLAFMGRYNPPGHNPPGILGQYPADTVWAIAVGSELSTARIVAQGGTEAPGTGGLLFETGTSYSITTTPGPALNNHDQIVFKAPLTGGRPNMHHDAIFFDDGANTSLVALWGNTAPGGSTFGIFGNAQLSDLGQLAFTAGADVDSSRTDEVLYATMPNGDLRRVMGIGDEVELTLPDGNITTKELLRIYLGHERQSAFNADGILALGGLFTDGSRAILALNLGPLTGDLDGDGFVGIDDLTIVLNNWNLSVPPGDPLADPSGDGFVGIDDLNLVLGNWNAGLPPVDEVGSVAPEPSAVCYGLLCVLTGLRRRA